MTDAADFTRQAAELVAGNDRVPTQRLSSGLMIEQDASLDRLAEAIAAHIKAPCDESGPCVFHRALSVSGGRMGA